MDYVAKQIYTLLMQAERIVLIPHQHPDGDALGSVSAFAQFLEQKKKAVDIFCKTDYPPTYNYLQQIGYLSTSPDLWLNNTYDVIVVFDSGDPNYAGVDKHIANLNYSPTIINIDHHASNIFFGDYNMVDTTASSTCEILHRFFRYLHEPISPSIATSLLTGLMYDTDNFTNGATNKSALLVGEDLIRRGGDRKLIYKNIFADTSITALKLWGQMLSRLTHHKEHDIVYTYVTQQDLTRLAATDDDTSGMANFMNSLGEGKVSMVLKEHANGTIKGSFRTTREDIDVSAWANALGGGGHKKAAGFTITGTIETAIQHVFQTISLLKLDESKTTT